MTTVKQRLLAGIEIFFGGKVWKLFLCNQVTLNEHTKKGSRKLKKIEGRKMHGSDARGRNKDQENVAKKRGPYLFVGAFDRLNRSHKEGRRETKGRMLGGEW